jgi:predicted ATPase
MPKLNSIYLKGYRPFKDFQAKFGSVEVMVGANGSGKSSLFEFLKFLRDSLKDDIPPEIVTGSIGQQVFHLGQPERFWWSLEMDFGQAMPLRYQGEVMGPVGNSHISFERVVTVPKDGRDNGYLFMNVNERKGIIQDPESKKLKEQDLELKKPNQLALSTVTNPLMVTLYNLKEYIEGWRFYSSFKIKNEKIRQAVPTEQEPVLNEDAGNLSAVLFYLYSEHPDSFDELQRTIKMVVPGFKRLSVKAKGAPGHVMGFWREEGFENDLSLADLSDGILRLICWLVLCVHPNPPSLICIDEPDQGVHPRTLPILASMFDKASERTQLFLATHSSYFLMQFELGQIAVMRKESGEAKFFKPNDSAFIKSSLEEFGNEELELLHRNDELEKLID